MAVFELVVGLLFAGALMAAVARRMNAPYPALLALLGAGLALLPNVPSVMLDPELALALLVAPVLLDSAFDASPRDLKQNWKPVTALALAAVCLTVVAVALVAHWVVPTFPGPVPSCSAPSWHLRTRLPPWRCCGRFRPPHRVLVILEGESLFNDATALLIYRFAVAAAVDRSLLRWECGSDAADRRRSVVSCSGSCSRGSCCLSPRESPISRPR